MKEGGHRLNHVLPVYEEQKPVISIITIVYNRKEDLQKTFASVFAQDYPNIDYVVIDGASTDGTLEVIEENAEKISYWRSEPDKGLYDAMNKGLAYAIGDYVWFMNAGDLIFDEQTCSKIANIAGRSADIYYGETMMFDEQGKDWGLRSEVTTQKLPKRMTWKSLRKGMVVCHQSILVKRSIAPAYVLNHPYSADIDWVIKALKRSSKIVNTGLILSRYLMGGYSKQHLKKSLLDRYEILKKHYGFVPNLLSHIGIVLRASLRSKKY